MTVVGVVLAVGILSGLCVALAVHHWPHADPLAPHVTPERVEVEVLRHQRLAAFAKARLDPRVATGLLLTAAVSVVVVGMAAFGVLLYLVRTHEGFARFDLGAARFGATNATAASTRLLRPLTQLGGAVVLFPVALFVAVVESARGKAAVVTSFLLLAVGGQFLVVNAIKGVVERARPDLVRLTGFSGSSFPSGHAAAAAASLAAFALVLGRRRSRPVRTTLAASAVGLAVAVASTRVLLGVHWLTDVLAGLAIGWTWFALCSIAFGGRLLHYGEPVAVAEDLAPRVPA
jgi:undecaprenyl-diphosphatase